MRLITAGAVLLVLGSTAGCGAILHGTRQEVPVTSSPSGAQVETMPSTGIFATPVTLDLERKHSYTLTFTSPGYQPATLRLEPHIGVGTVVADVLLTGLIGVLVDGLTGAWYGLRPEQPSVTLARAGDGDGPEAIHVKISQAADGHGVLVSADAPGISVAVVSR